MKTRTRAQEDMALACTLVGEVEKDENVRRIYGGLCHSFPVLVRTCGLCQAVAFSEAKKSSSDDARAKAHRLLLEHTGKILKIEQDIGSAIRKAETADYIHYTRRLLASWIYFKRFAVSILKVDSSASAKEDINGE